jgi:hypothetical protein
MKSLSLKSNFEETQMNIMATWAISLKLKRRCFNYLPFRNTFIRVKGGSWYKMTYDEASRFATLSDELK